MLRAFADLGFRWKIALPILLLVVLLVLMGGLGMQGCPRSRTPASS